MPAHSINHGRAYLLERKHPIIVKLVEPAILFAGSALCFLALLAIEGAAICVGFIAVGWAALKVFF